jgi:hypothetical protein
VAAEMRPTSDTFTADTFQQPRNLPHATSLVQRARTRPILNNVILGCPRHLPDALARSRPTKTRSRIIARSNSLDTPSIQQGVTRCRPGVEALLVQAARSR